MKEIRDGTQSNRTPLALDVDDFKGDFSFDDTFGNLVTEVLPSCLEKEVDSLEGHGNIDGISNGHMRAPSMSNAGKLLSSPLFPEVDALLSLFKNSSSQLVEQKRQVDAKLSNLTKEVSVQDLKHRKTLAELEKGVDGLFGSFARLDSRISSVGHTAAKIGDHLQSADTQRESASQTIELIKYLMEFNRSAGDLTQLSPLFIDDNRVAEAASIAQKLRSFADEDIGRQKTTVSSAVGNATSHIGLEVAITNLQEYCNALENRLLARFDTATQKRDLSTMGEYGKILSQFNRGTSAMQHYVGLRPMFDVAVMNADAKLVLGDEGAQPSPSNVAHGLSSMFKEIADTVRKEAATIAAVFPSPKDVMSILVQRVLEDRVPKLLEKLLLKPSLVNPPPMAEGGLVLYLRLLAVAYEKTQEFDKELRSVGCGDLDVEGLTESLFLPHKDIYIECEQASLKQLYKAKMDELRSESQLSSSESSGTIGRSKGASIVLSNPEISVTVVTEFVRWNEEAISRCSLFYLQPAALAASIKPIFTCLLDQVSQYIIGGLERAREGLTEAAALREKHLLGTSVSRRVAAAAASAAENAAAAGESSFKSFMASVQRCGSSVAILQQYFVNSISRRLLPVDGAHAASSEEMATTMSRAESIACKGLQQCIETVIAEVERLLSTEQKATDYRSPDDGIIPDHRPTSACACAVAYLSRVLESAFTGLEGLNKQAFLTELGNRLHKGLLNHWQKFTFNPSGGLRLKRDITEYGEFVRSFNAPQVDEKFEQLGIIANVFIVAPESLGPLFEGTPSIKKDAQRFIQLRDDYKNAKLASKLSSLWS
ncbi:exocyst complex component SEC10b-like [Solanum lycopersicum]|uniref:exocyst complex component SEC10b-like n=1 Tax=Solanum lycopersicum TaxID=4081 RepID=UPI0037489124